LRRSHSRALQLREYRRLLHSQPDVQRHADQEDRYQEWDAPAVSSEMLFGHGGLHSQDHYQRDKQSEGSGNLDEAGIETPLLIRHMAGHNRGCTAILPAQSQPLQHPDRDERDRRKPSSSQEGRQQSDRRSARAHYYQGDQERIFASDQVAYSTEKQGPERPNQKPHSKRCKVGNIGEGLVLSRIKL